jgi:hypothetical protein
MLHAVFLAGFLQEVHFCVGHAPKAKPGVFESAGPIIGLPLLADILAALTQTSRVVRAV